MKPTDDRSYIASSFGFFRSNDCTSWCRELLDTSEPPFDDVRLSLARCSVL